jgi:carbon storage regulator CsrA
MLILRRKAGQSILITQEIKIIILSGIGDIRIGVDAPKDMQILRSELLQNYRSFINNLRPAITE